MGGTGLSGLALSDTAAWPGAYGGLFYVANPITRKVQPLQVSPDGPRFRYQKQPDFLLSSDEWFRPVCIHFGPDGCLYIVDWYNKIISHNEVPRNRNSIAARMAIMAMTTSNSINVKANRNGPGCPPLPQDLPRGFIGKSL